MEPLEIILWIAPVVVSIAIPILYYAVRINRELYKHGQELEANRYNMDKLHECDERIEKKLDNYKTNHTLESEKYKNQFDSKIDKLDDRIDRLGSKIDTIMEKVSQSEHVHQELKQMLKEQMNFFTDWIQRIEDVTRDDPDFVLSRRRGKREDG